MQKVCMSTGLHYSFCAVIGAHTYHLSVSLKLQNRDGIRNFPCSAFFPQQSPLHTLSLPQPLLSSPLCLSPRWSRLWPFVQSSAGLINHTHSTVRWHRWERDGFIITVREGNLMVVGEAWSFLKAQPMWMCWNKETSIQLWMLGKRKQKIDG